MGWTEVAQAVIARRVELGMKTRQQLSETTGLSVKTLGEIERSVRTSYDPATLAAVEQALKWPSGTITATVRGAATGRALERVEEPDPLDAKLARLETAALTLNPSDLRRLNANVQTLIEWAMSRGGLPEPTEDQVAATETMQRLTRDMKRQQEAHARGEVPVATERRVER